MLIETQPTPNPQTLKFMPGRTVMPAGTRDFPSPEEAEVSPLAESLFAIGDVSGVFFGRDFISVTLAPGGDWGTAKPQVFGVLLDHFGDEQPLFHAPSAAAIHVPDEVALGPVDHEDAEIIAQIEELIETRIRPAVANDGGDIVFRGYRDGQVFLQMQGACSGCPSASATLKHGVETLLKHYVPEVTDVIQV